MSEKEVASNLTQVGLIWDEMNQTVLSVVVRDVLLLKQESFEGVELFITKERYQQVAHMLSAWVNDSRQLLISHYKDEEKTPDALIWIRYTSSATPVELPVPVEQILDRDFCVPDTSEDRGGDLSWPNAAPNIFQPNQHRMAPPSANPLNRPMPNPLNKPYFQFASVVDHLNHTKISRSKGNA